jgi:hypothetical protein
MRFVLIILLGALLTAGCAKPRPDTPAAVAGGPGGDEVSEPFAATPTAHAGRVSMVNTGARFAVVTFPLGSMPVTDQRLSVYRDGLKVAELKVTGPQMDNNTVADILTGDARTNDEVRLD